jgi:25S rRNA (uracil2843-N3)-methyltransferase
LQAYLRAYAARWVSGRSLAYRSLLLDIPELVETSQRRARQGQITRTFCIGGGAGSEILALASLTKELEFDVKMHVTAVDVADWNEILTEMGDLIKTRWKEQGMETENKFKLEFKRANMLQDFNDLHFEEQHIITCLFTTNELFAESRVKTMALLSHLSNTCKKGTLLVIAESTGTYSEIQMGSKVYPLELVLDMTLVGKNKEWEIVKQEQSRWYRVPEESKGKYELQIENTHMLVRVYRKA